MSNNENTESHGVGLGVFYTALTIVTLISLRKSISYGLLMMRTIGLSGKSGNTFDTTPTYPVFHPIV
ncbi:MULTISPECIES: hypothetical protein [unclassified Geobacillus]|uniref:hypothetical protein n=1 Tax=unclassified Geobacillus TaxID=2642459 RepID=UPI0016500AD2|nr:MULTISPECIES: hypothetical protein [unclassified Geobacillus]